jgi:hypothetical protein
LIASALLILAVTLLYTHKIMVGKAALLCLLALLAIAASSATAESIEVTSNALQGEL